MHLDTLRACCLALPAVEECFPFDEETLVFKVGGKMFALIGLDALPPAVVLKCDPERAVELREQYEAVQPGYHMNKKHWNTVLISTGASENQLRELIDHSYNLVVASLPKSVKAVLEQ